MNHVVGGLEGGRKYARTKSCTQEKDVIGTMVNLKLAMTDRQRNKAQLRCKAIAHNGRQCSFGAVWEDYCTKHWKVYNNRYWRREKAPSIQ